MNTPTGNRPTVKVTDPACPEGLTWTGSYLDLFSTKEYTRHWVSIISHESPWRLFKWAPYDTVVVTHGDEFSIERIVIEPTFRFNCSDCGMRTDDYGLFWGSLHNC